jgi:hypothetical protein
LKQVIGVKKVLLLSDSRPIRVPESEADDLAVPVDEGFGRAAPVPAVSSEDLYAVRKGSVQRVGGSPQPGSQVDPLPGALGRRGSRVDSLAVSVGNEDLAVVTDGRTVLRRTSTTGTDVSTVLRDVTGLLRPQLSRNGELWALGSVHGRQRIWVVTGDGTTQVTAPVLKQGPVKAFRVSPDGSRIALLVGRGRRTTLGVARINRSDGIAVDGWHVLDTSTALNTSTIATVRDVSWRDASTLLVLGAANRQSPYVLSTVSDDAAELETDPQTNDWDAQSLAVLLRTGSAVVVTADGRVFRDDDVQWTELLDGVSAVAYPG